MNKVVMSLAALMVSAAPAFAADMPVKAMKAPVAAPSPWDVAFGVAFTTDYVLRGVSQTNKTATVQGYFEVDYTVNDWLKFYAGVWGSGLAAYNANAEIDPNAGARLTFGNFGLDIGAIYYYYPDGPSAAVAFGGGYDGWVDGYIKPSYKFNDWLSIGGVFDYGNNFNNGLGIVGSKNQYFAAGNATVTLPQWMPWGITTSINGEYGHQDFSCTTVFGSPCTSYNWWDVGLIFNYKAATLDLRYWDTDKHGTFISPASYGSKDLGGSKFVATLKFDTTWSALK
jgi:uncharacterized protein (TIGR02001 family)